MKNIMFGVNKDFWLILQFFKFYLFFNLVGASEFYRINKIESIITKEDEIPMNYTSNTTKFITYNNLLRRKSFKRFAPVLYQDYGELRLCFGCMSPRNLQISRTPLTYKRINEVINKNSIKKLKVDNNESYNIGISMGDGNDTNAVINISNPIFTFRTVMSLGKNESHTINFLISLMIALVTVWMCTKAIDQGSINWTEGLKNPNFQFNQESLDDLTSRVNRQFVQNIITKFITGIVVYVLFFFGFFQVVSASNKMIENLVSFNSVMMMGMEGLIITIAMIVYALIKRNECCQKLIDYPPISYEDGEKTRTSFINDTLLLSCNLISIFALFHLIFYGFLSDAVALEVVVPLPSGGFGVSQVCPSGYVKAGSDCLSQTTFKPLCLHNEQCAYQFYCWNSSDCKSTVPRIDNPFIARECSCTSTQVFCAVPCGSSGNLFGSNITVQMGVSSRAVEAYLIVVKKVSRNQFSYCSTTGGEAKAKSRCNENTGTLHRSEYFYRYNKVLDGVKYCAGNYHICRRLDVELDFILKGYVLYSFENYDGGIVGLNTTHLSLKAQIQSKLTTLPHGYFTDADQNLYDLTTSGDIASNRAFIVTKDTDRYKEWEKAIAQKTYYNDQSLLDKVISTIAADWQGGTTDNSEKSYYLDALKTVEFSSTCEVDMVLTKKSSGAPEIDTTICHWRKDSGSGFYHIQNGIVFARSESPFVTYDQDTIGTLWSNLNKLDGFIFYDNCTFSYESGGRSTLPNEKCVDLTLKEVRSSSEEKTMIRNFLELEKELLSFLPSLILLGATLFILLLLIITCCIMKRREKRYRQYKKEDF